jgi:tetratricopeptide (TPR) repeat protein
LEENEQKLLRHFVLWQSEYIEYDVIADLLKGVFESEDELINTLTSLSKRSILTTNNEDTLSYKLHGLLANSLREQIKIENEDYDEYLWNIYRIIAYGYYKFVPFVDCIGNSLCEYDITNNNATLHNVALKYYNSWKANYSEKLYNKAIKICLKKLTSDKDNATYQNDLASAYNCLAILQKNHLRDYDSAKANYEKAIAIRKQLPKDNPQYQNDLANTYNDLAILQRKHLGDYDSAKANYEKAIEIGEQLPKDNPEYQNDLANAYNNLAILLNKQKKYESAELNINSAIAIHQRLSNLNPHFLVDFLGSKVILASIYKSRGNPSSIRKTVEILFEIKPLAEKCLSDNPYDSRAQTLNKNINNLADLRVKAERIYKGCIIFLVIAIILTAILWYVLR